MRESSRRPEGAPAPRLPSLLLLVGAAGVPASLLWDFSFESTVGVDLFWSPPHTATYLSVALAGGAALACARPASSAQAAGVALGGLRAPLGAWLALWGALAFAVAVVFDRWWQTGYGLAAGIWHPPQILKAVAFGALALGAWLARAARPPERGSALAWAACGAAALALVGVVTLPSSFANRQHSAGFYQLACATYPIALTAIAVAGQARLSATTAALGYTLLVAAMVWILPLVPGSPQVGPIYNPRDHLLPPPFPLLLVAPALALDLVLGRAPERVAGARSWLLAALCGLAFLAAFGAAQWWFAAFLLSPAADGWLFAGGGRHWPFFLRVDPSARTAFWHGPGDALTPARAALALGCAVLTSRAGIWLGCALRRLAR
jgi:hypothetical protein